MTDRELMQQALDSLDSDNPDIQLRTAIALRNRMSQSKPLFSTPVVTPEVTPYVIDCPRCGHCCPEQKWVGLTDEEIKEIIGPWGDTPIKGYTRKLFDQIETKLREKNGG
jgi:hypothetical protein